MLAKKLLKNKNVMFILLPVFRFLVISAIFFSPFVYQKLICEFRIAKIDQSTAKRYPRLLETLNLDSARQILSQNFSYFSHGAQSYVFLSHDGKYTLKLFRNFSFAHPLRMWIRKQILRKKAKLDPQSKMEALYSACQLSFEKGADLTGLVYLHLHSTDLNLKTMIKDSLGREFVLDLDRYNFAIQHRGYHLRDVFIETMNANDVEKFTRLSKAFARHLYQRVSRNLKNTDSKVTPNFGFRDETIIEWDFANFIVDEKIDKEKEIDQFKYQILELISKYRPNWTDLYIQQFSKKMQEDPPESERR